jgi:hypothetical protein
MKIKLEDVKPEDLVRTLRRPYKKPHVYVDPEHWEQPEGAEPPDEMIDDDSYPLNKHEHSKEPPFIPDAIGDIQI